jgi:hypothetical protein
MNDAAELCLRDVIRFRNYALLVTSFHSWSEHYVYRRMSYNVWLFSTAEGLVHIQLSILNIYSNGLTFYTTGLTSFPVSIEKVSNCIQLQYFVVFYKDVACGKPQIVPLV